MEDEHGTYIMNSKDLRAIEHIGRLVEIGVDSLKIEGRTKSVYYVVRTAQAYRQAIDDAVAGRPFDTRLLGALQGLANRGYTDGFYKRHHTQEYQNYLSALPNCTTAITSATWFPRKTAGQPFSSKTVFRSAIHWKFSIRQATRSFRWKK